MTSIKYRSRQIVFLFEKKKFESPQDTLEVAKKKKS